MNTIPGNLTTWHRWLWEQATEREDVPTPAVARLTGEARARRERLEGWVAVGLLAVVPLWVVVATVQAMTR